MNDFSCSESDKMNYKILADRARYFKQTEKGGMRRCKAMEGLIEEEKLDRSMEIAVEMIKDDSLSLEKIAHFAKPPIENVRNLSKNLPTVSIK